MRWLAKYVGTVLVHKWAIVVAGTRCQSRGRVGRLARLAATARSPRPLEVLARRAHPYAPLCPSRAHDARRCLASPRRAKRPSPRALCRRAHARRGGRRDGRRLDGRQPCLQWQLAVLRRPLALARAQLGQPSTPSRQQGARQCDRVCARLLDREPTYDWGASITDPHLAALRQIR